MKSKRGWLEAQKDSGSMYAVNVSESDWDKGDTSLTLGDCFRRITWEFGRPGNKRGVKKIKKVKALIEELYEHIVPENQR